MNSKSSIQVNDLTKYYKLYDKSVNRVKEAVSLTRKKHHTDFMALGSVSFDIKKKVKLLVLSEETDQANRHFLRLSPVFLPRARAT